ncbi:hypothetical protein R3P38DRAFT_2777268 [Favolaschia claudopus]|uniref:Uncharacterized protein n=1 Tax=Favolaschia claudopus TaxID=2862362 RepID=A0AAW0BMJ9_9AGAR
MDYTGVKGAVGGATERVTNGRGRELKVVSIQVLPCGTFVDKEHHAVPNKVAIQQAKIDNIAVVNNTEGIVVDRDATYADVVDLLNDLIPLPFAYFSRVETEQEGFEPVWYLLTPVKGRLVVVPSDNGSLGPDGAALDFNKGNSTTGFRNSRIFIASRDPVPIELLREWAPSTSPTYKQHDIDEGKWRRLIQIDYFSLPIEEVEEASADSDVEQYIPTRKNKRRLSSSREVAVGAESGSDNERPHKRRKALSKTWTRSPEVSDDDFIDLTLDNASNTRSTPDFLRKPPRSPPPREDPASPGRSEIHVDATLGNPYDKNAKFEF